MKYFRKFSEGIAGGDVVSACCRQLGWPINKRPGAGTGWLHFDDSLLGIRELQITIGHNGLVVGITAFSESGFPKEQIPFSALLDFWTDNRDVVVTWRPFKRGSGNVVFALFYTAFTDDLDHGKFKQHCESLVKAAKNFDAMIRPAGSAR